jgi:hypothetical protein
MNLFFNAIVAIFVRVYQYMDAHVFKQPRVVKTGIIQLMWMVDSIWISLSWFSWYCSHLSLIGTQIDVKYVFFQSKLVMFVYVTERNNTNNIKSKQSCTVLNINCNQNIAYHSMQKRV